MPWLLPDRLRSSGCSAIEEDGVSDHDGPYMMGPYRYLVGWGLDDRRVDHDGGVLIGS